MHPSAFGIVLLLGTGPGTGSANSTTTLHVTHLLRKRFHPFTPFLLLTSLHQIRPFTGSTFQPSATTFRPFPFRVFPLLLGWVHQSLHRPLRSKAVLRGKHGKHILEKKLRSGYNEASHNRFVHKYSVSRTERSLRWDDFYDAFLASPFHETNPVLPREGVRRVWKQASSTTTSDKILIKNNLFIHRSIRRLGNGTENVK